MGKIRIQHLWDGSEEQKREIFLLPGHGRCISDNVCSFVPSTGTRMKSPASLRLRQGPRREHLHGLIGLKEAEYPEPPVKQMHFSLLVVN